MEKTVKFKKSSALDMFVFILSIINAMQYIICFYPLHCQCNAIYYLFLSFALSMQCNLLFCDHEWRTCGTLSSFLRHLKFLLGAKYVKSCPNQRISGFQWSVTVSVFGCAASTLVQILRFHFILNPLLQSCQVDLSSGPSINCDRQHLHSTSLYDVLWYLEWSHIVSCKYVM